MRTPRGTKLTVTTGPFYRMAAKSKNARESMPEGDFRDWGSVGEWADEIAEALTKGQLAKSTSRELSTPAVQKEY